MKRSRPSAHSPSFPAAVSPLVQLRDLSRNLWWSWDTEVRDLWDHLAVRLGVPEDVRSPMNPVRLLQAAKAKDLQDIAGSPDMVDEIRRAHRRFLHALSGRGPVGGAIHLPGPVAYFSMEFGVHESLPIYAGGLGILAGDHTKTASDLGLPLIGVGLFYHEGYFRQSMDAAGRHVVRFPRADTSALPLEPIKDTKGRELRIRVELPGRTVTLRAWRVRVGRVELLLLDSNLPGNTPRDRTITDRLYIGDREMRITQEVVAGIGGVRALRALGVRPAVWHLNEGHTAFLTLERIRELAAGPGRREGLTFDEAVETIAADTVFTTHTPVAEGNEAFSLDLARRFLEPLCAPAGISVDDYLELGLDGMGTGRPFFSMTVLAIRMSRFRNGVSKLHGTVSRRMWQRLWPGFPAEDGPIGSVTNGVHTPTWVGSELDWIYRRDLGPDWKQHLHDEAFWQRAQGLGDQELWAVKGGLKLDLINFVRHRKFLEMAGNGIPREKARRAAERLLDPDALTIGFSRRFALYKRADLLFQDLRRARALLGNPRRPVQIVFAGKPHPEDRRGAALFEGIARISALPGFRGKVVVLAGYDMEVARFLVQGVDVWLNTPRRPLEASGTSGQKVPINGGLNLSISDGWWNEGYGPDAGWAFGKPIGYSDPQVQDREDLDDLLRVLERQVIPLYFQRDAHGIPRKWLRLVKSSMARLVPQFSAARMLLDYVQDYYQPAAENARLLREAGLGVLREIADLRRALRRTWPMVHVLRAERVRGGRRAEVDVFTGGLEPWDLAAEVVAPAPGRSTLPSVPGRRTPASKPVAVSFRAVQDGVVRFAFPVRRGVAARLRIWPSHAALPHPRELGVSLEAEV